jgi:Cu(I)/Ag(I) efflux system membrane fusion protein/cobalt-zinc-cadmium efflux system membrane fusion protein
MSKKQILWGLVLILIGVFVGWMASSWLGGPSKGAGEAQVTSAQEEGGEKHLWTCGMHPEVILDKPGNCPICGMKLVPLKKPAAAAQTAAGEKGEKPKKERKILYWRAPMDPTEIYDHPGKSKMGMDLIPVYEDEATLGAGGTITIDPVVVQNMGVRTAPVRRVNFQRSIRTVGYVEFNEEKLYTVTTKISGWIEKLYVDATGDLVQKGDPLLDIYSPELVTTQQEYLLALKTREMVKESDDPSIRESAETLVRSTRQRLLYWDIPEEEIAFLEQTGQVRKTIQLKAPAKGVVIHKNAVEGMFVKEGQPLYRIADLSTIWIHVSVYDYEAPWVYVGQEAEIELAYLPGKTYRGKVVYIYPYLNEKTRDLRVRLEFPNPNFELKPGMFASVKLFTRPMPGVLAIPTEAVIRSGKRNVVFVARGNGRFEPREVKIGEEGDNGMLRVISGLLEGEKVVTSAQFLLDSESRLQEAIQKMLQEKMAQTKKKS